MTYIEFFDPEATKNLSACMLYKPERVVFVGHDEDVMDRCTQRYEAMFADRKTPIRFLYRYVEEDDLPGAVRILSDIVEEFDQCVFDLTGGQEILNVALGVVYARYPDRQIHIHQYDMEKNEIYDCIEGSTVIGEQLPTLSVKENIRVRGGDIRYGEVWEEDSYEWDLSEEFLRDLEKMWGICKANPRLWNRQMGLFDAMEQVNTEDPEVMTTCVKATVVKAWMEKEHAPGKYIKGVVTALSNKKLISGFSDADGMLTVTYKNPQVKRCLTKAGTVLELRMLIAARDVKYKGEPVYNDTMSGVQIDWDGKFHDPLVDGEYDTENEIDLVLMHGMVPVFVSCKNGDVKADELYKLDTVASRFGGPHVKKALVTTCLSKNPKVSGHFRQRAKDMHIDIIEDLGPCNPQQLSKKFKKLWK